MIGKNAAGKTAIGRKNAAFPFLVLLLCCMISLPGRAGVIRSQKHAVTKPSGDMAVRAPEKPMVLLSSAEAEDLNEKMSSYSPKEDSLLKNNARTFYYYNNLEPIPKEIYDILLNVLRDPVSEGNIGLMITDMDPQSDEFYFYFNVAVRAVCFDHPEVFWLYSDETEGVGYYSEAVNMGGFYFVYFKMIEPYTDFERVMTGFNTAVDVFLSDIDTSISEYDTVRQIHDKLIDQVNYNDPIVDFRKSGDLGHTAYGALVADSSGNPNYAVCDGYSFAFEYLLQQCGIEVVFMCGTAGANAFEAGGHAWNMVNVNDVWYEVDSTWDDSGSMIDDLDPYSEEYPYYMEALNNSAYREKIDHFLFLVSTDRISHFVPGEEYDYLTNDQKWIYCLVGESIHDRFTYDFSFDPYNPEKMDSAVISLAPVALQSFR